MPNVEIEALATLTWIRRGEHAIVEDGPGVRKLVEKNRVRIVRGDVVIATDVPFPTADQLADVVIVPSAEQLAES
jgi:hypothetical protein